MATTFVRLCAAVLSTTALGACVLPPKESAHPTQLDKAQVGLTGAAVEPAADGWWSSFQDPQLDRLIRAGLKDSPTLAQARARVGDALARTEVAQAGLKPSARLGASVT